MACGKGGGGVTESRTGVRGHLMETHRLVFAALVLLALVSGYLGFATFLRGNAQFGHGPLDLLYDDLQLFVLGPFPLQEGGTHLPITLEIGRLVAPLVTIYAFIEAGRLFLTTELQRRRIQRLRGHVVVCGAGSIAEALSRRLAEIGDEVVVVRPATAESSRPGRREVLGDPREPAVLRTAAVHRARIVYACADDTATSTAIALAVTHTAVGGGPALAVYVHAPDADLCVALQARHIGRSRSSRAHVEFFNVDEVAARKVVDDHVRRTDPNKPEQVLVIGASAFGRAVVVELARHWRATRPDPDAMPAIVLADEHAVEAIADITYRYQFVADACDLRADDRPSAQFPVVDRQARPTAVFVCLADEEACLRTALTADGLWHGGPGSVIVRLSQLGGFPDAFQGADGDPLLDADEGVLRLFDVVKAACDPAVINDGLVERLARVVHDRYRRACLERGGEGIESPSMVAWDRLPATLRQSCRSQAEDVGHKLRSVGCTLAPRVAPGEEHQFTDETIEVLAQMEQRRWMSERSTEGWTFGHSRNDVSLRHPDLLPWDLLSSVAQNKNRDAMRELGSIVADAGLRIVQLR